ncbi:MAG: hypothetical protein IT350_16910 [Deltaproteobacteria bacterium]|nr:hypothetical protein [Deltaproteobacteria bacterium]
MKNRTNIRLSIALLIFLFAHSPAASASDWKAFEAARSLSDAGRHVESETALKNLLAAGPSPELEPEIRSALARVYEEKLLKFDEAKEQCRIVVEKTPNHRRVRYCRALLARVERGTRRDADDLEYEEIIANYDRAPGGATVARIEEFLTRRPDFRRAAEARFVVAKETALAGRHPEAIVEYEKILAMNPPTRVAVDALRQIAWSHISMDRYSNAEATYGRMRAIRDDGFAAKAADDGLKKLERKRARRRGIVLGAAAVVAAIACAIAGALIARRRRGPAWVAAS